MPSTRTKLGTQGEAVAAAHLEAQGMSIVGRNFRTRYGEVDLIAQDGDSLVFVEVKTRRSGAYGTPEESVTPRKRERLAKTAQRYLQEQGREQSAWRLDLIAITLRADAPADINDVRGIEGG